MNVIGLWIALACAPKHEEPAVAVGPDTSPIVPALSAPVYATGHTLPKDPLVAQVGLGLRWDEGLSGAAAALALATDQTPNVENAQYAAYRAGYPYPIRALSVGQVASGAYPEGLATTLRNIVGKADALGLARVRTGDKDRWVALVSSPRGALRPINREHPVGQTVEIRTDVPGSWAVVSPTGVAHTGEIPGAIELSEQGEWWLEVHGPEGLVVSLPLYAGMTTPPGSVLDLPGPVAAGPSEAVVEAFERLNTVRKAFSLHGIREDGTLATLAEYPLEQVLVGDWDAASGKARLQAAGFVGGPVAQVKCTGNTVSICLDNLLRSGIGREVLLDPDYRIGGAATQVATDGVTLLLNLASE